MRITVTKKISLVFQQSDRRISNTIEHKSCVVDVAPVMGLTVMIYNRQTDVSVENTHSLTVIFLATGENWTLIPEQQYIKKQMEIDIFKRHFVNENLNQW